MPYGGKIWRMIKFNEFAVNGTGVKLNPININNKVIFLNSTKFFMYWHVVSEMALFKYFSVKKLPAAVYKAPLSSPPYGKSKE